jgi:P-type Ca2+ transporter type 2C
MQSTTELAKGEAADGGAAGASASAVGAGGAGAAEAVAWHRLDAGAASERLGASRGRGLDEAEAARRVGLYGPNELIETGAKSPWRILWEQLTSVMVLILIAAALISAAVADFKDAAVILAIVVLFAVLGFIQEYRAERAMAALKKLAVPFVRVRRSGEVREVSARELVPGDLVLLEAGNKIPADLRLTESVNLRVEEAALTGESEPVEKETGALTAENPPLGDRRNMAYMGTVVTYGRGSGLVVETGMRTELGRIASMIQSVSREYTPLQRRLDQLGKALGVIALAVAGLIFGLGLLRGEELSLMLMTAVSVAVAAVPEGLPAVVTITLALGAQRMLRRRALIRKLPAVETLGSVTVICSDKTGTLTENRMTVTVLDVAGGRLSLAGREAKHDLETLLKSDEAGDGGGAAPAAAHENMRLLLTAGALCNDAVAKQNGHPGSFEIIGDPTEGALVVAAARLGLDKSELEAAMPRAAELPFDSARKRMTTVHRLPASGPISEGLRAALSAVSPEAAGATRVAFVKGAVDGLLDLSTHALDGGDLRPLDARWRARIEAANAELAGDGMRVLGVAFRLLGESSPVAKAEEVESRLVFVGLFGMIDPPRAEVREAVRTCRDAGIRPVMITGDHPLTAAYIARDLGIAREGEPAVTGQDLDRMTDEEFRRAAAQVSVFARVSPEHKYRIVEALQAGGHVVAMTGDGVNDAPALKKANIGVAMGITGTDVSKEAAEMVLRDDNFATIVAAVEEGRTIYDNIRKFIKFSVAGNIGKILTVLVGPLVGMPLTLLPLQLLWLNLLTDGLLGLGLGVEKSERNVMRRPPQSPAEGIFARGMGRHIVWLGAMIGAVSLGVGYWYWQAGAANWQTMTFTTLAFVQIGQALAVRSTHDSLFRIGVGSNRLLLAMAFVVFAAQAAVVFVAPLQEMFGTQPLSAADFLLSVSLGAAVFLAVEFEKWWGRRRAGAPALRAAEALRA